MTRHFRLLSIIERGKKTLSQRLQKRRGRRGVALAKERKEEGNSREGIENDTPPQAEDEGTATRHAGINPVKEGLQSAGEVAHSEKEGVRASPIFLSESRGGLQKFPWSREGASIWPYKSLYLEAGTGGSRRAQRSPS